MKKIFIPFVFAAALVALPLSAAAQKAREVTTTGTVNVTIPADSAQLHVSVSALEPTLDQSNSRLDASIDAFQAELKKRGIPASAVTLKNRDARKEWRDQYEKKVFRGYRTTVKVIVSIEDISKLSPLITYIGLHEDYDASDPILRSSKIGVEKKAVLALALRLAREKALILAEEGGAKLGALLNATEENGQADPYRNFSPNPSNYRVSVAAPSDNSAAIDNDPSAVTPAGNHVIAINVRIVATHALE